MKMIRNLTVLLFAILMIGCAAKYKIHDVHYGYDRGADFKSLKSYGWIYIHVKGNIGAYTIDKIENAVQAQLEGRGLSETKTSPDILVGAYAGREEKVITRLMSSYGRGPGGSWRGERISTHQYTEGTLILDFIEAKNKKLIWRGWATAKVLDDLTLEKREKLVNDAVKRIFENFPPPLSK